jgi:hypothetical protein
LHIGNLGHRLHGCGERLAERCLFERKAVGNAIQLIGTGDEVAREGAVNTVTDASPAATEDEVAGSAMFAVSACDGCGAEHGDTFSDPHVPREPPDFHDGARALVAQDHGWVVAKPVVEDVEIGAAHATIGDLDLHLLVAAPRLLHVEDVDIALAGGELHQSLHPSGILCAQVTPSAVRPPGVACPFLRGCVGDREA